MQTLKLNLSWGLWEMSRSHFKAVSPQRIRERECLYWLRADPETHSFSHETGLPGTGAPEKALKQKNAGHNSWQYGRHIY